jgi:hypothetical protein
MYKEKSSLRLIVLALSISGVVGVVLIRPNLQRPSAPAGDVRTERASEAKPVRTQAAAADQNRPAPVAEASGARPEVDTTPDVEALSNDQLSAEVARVDREIEDGDYVARANTGQLKGADFDHFGALLARRDALHVAKIQRLLATLDTRAQHNP